MKDSEQEIKIVGLRKDGTPIYFDSLDFQKKSKTLSQLSEIDKEILKNASKKEKHENN